MITARGLNRATLARQLLLSRVRLPAPDAVRHLVGLQAQAPASPYLALWNRISGFAAADLDAAFSEGTLVKATLMRITLHAVHAEDHPAWHSAMTGVLRAARLGDARFTRSGLSIAEADALMPALLSFLAEPRTGPEIEAMLERPGLWWALRTFAPLRHVPDDHEWSFGKRAFVALRAGDPPVFADLGVRELVLRYLTAFGPATVADIRQFTLLPAALIRAALRDLSDQLTVSDHLYDVPHAPLPPDETPAPPRLLGMWDNTLLAYADRARIIPPAYRRTVIRMNGDVLPCVLVDGYVAGVWRALPAGIEVTAFQAFPRRVWADLSVEVAYLRTFLADRDPQVYSRYTHWWSKPLPAVETRLLP